MLYSTKRQHVRTLLPFVCILACLFMTLPAASQQTQTADSLLTPFRKGRWFSGLSGEIGATSSSTGSSGEKTFTNQFGMDFTTGRFIQDRWLIGARLSADRSDAAGGVERTTESLFIGPYASFYFSRYFRGSLYVTLSPGYVRYRDETVFTVLPVPIRQNSEGAGFGTLISLGYSYVILDRIAFDIGFNLNLYWIDLERDSGLESGITNENIALSNIVFSFGFNVLLDDFFF